MTASPTAAPSASVRRGLGSDLRTVGRQVYYEQLNFWLNPIAAAFTIVFSVVFLVLLGASAGNSTSTAIGGAKIIQYYVPGFVAYGIMSTCFTMLSSSLVVRRETGLLKRLRLSPLPTRALMAAISLNAIIISFLQVILLLLIGSVGYGVSIPGNLLALVVAIVVGVICFTAIGIGASTLIPNQEAAGPITSVVFFVLLFLSGLWFPISSHSALADISSVFPIRHMILATFAPFDKRPGVSAWAWKDLGVMAVWGVVGVYVAARRWSWAPRRPSGGRRRFGRSKQASG